jgi:hypothetical protein
MLISFFIPLLGLSWCIYPLMIARYPISRPVDRQVRQLFVPVLQRHSFFSTPFALSFIVYYSDRTGLISQNNLREVGPNKSTLSD